MFVGVGDNTILECDEAKHQPVTSVEWFCRYRIFLLSAKHYAFYRTRFHFSLKLTSGLGRMDKPQLLCLSKKTKFCSKLSDIAEKNESVYHGICVADYKDTLVLKMFHVKLITMCIKSVLIKPRTTLFDILLTQNSNCPITEFESLNVMYECSTLLEQTLWLNFGKRYQSIMEPFIPILFITFISTYLDLNVLL